MIVFVTKMTADKIGDKLDRWNINIESADLTGSEVRLVVAEEYRAQVRAWFAHDDDVLWFSKPTE